MTIVFYPWDGSLPWTTAFVTLFTWIAIDRLLQNVLGTRMGFDLDDYGMPRVRTASGMFTQLLFFPLLCLLSFTTHGSMHEWSVASGRAWFTASGERFWDWSFAYIFTAYMMSDLVRYPKMSAFMKGHHLVCLFAVAIGFVVAPAGFPHFVCLCVSLEFGSATLNLWCLFPDSPRCTLIYAGGMTLSNALAVWLYWNWTFYSLHVSLTCVGTFLFAGLLVLRQRGVFDVLRQC